MSTRPTPETDAFFATFADGEYAPSHAEYYARLQDLERERDEAREKFDTEATEHMLAINKICGERDEARDEIKMLKTNLEISFRQTEQAVQDRAEEHKTITAQRDRLAEALRSIKNELGVPQPEYPALVANAVKIADEALQSLTQKP